MNKKLLFTALFTVFVFSVHQAQEVDYNGKQYKVHGSSILLSNYDITESLTLDDRREILQLAKANEDAYKARKKELKAEEKARTKARKKESKAVEKAKRKAEKDKKFIIF